MPRLPPVPISPQARLLARLRPGVTPSVVTLLQSHSSSSATSCAKPVSVPCPISERAMRITQVSSGLIATQTLTSLAAAPFCALANGTFSPSARPPPATAAEPTMNFRRERCLPLPNVIFLMARSLRLAAGGRATGCHVDRFADALIGAAAADVGHRRVNVLVGRPRVLLQERRRRHDLAGLTVAALRHVDRRPGLLHRMRRVRRKPLDGDDLVGGLDAADRNRARAHHFAVDVHRAGAALRDAAAVFRAGQADVLADDPEERRVVLDAHIADFAVDVQLSHVSPPSTAYGRHIVLAFLSWRFRWAYGPLQRRSFSCCRGKLSRM